MHVVCGSPARAHLAYGCRHVSARTRKLGVTTRRERHRAGGVGVVVGVGGLGCRSEGLFLPHSLPHAWDYQQYLRLRIPRPPCRLANLQKLDCPLILFLGAINIYKVTVTLRYITLHLAKKKEKNKNKNKNKAKESKIRNRIAESQKHRTYKPHFPFTQSIITRSHV